MKISIVNLQKKIPLGLALSRKVKKAVLGIISKERPKKTGQINICFVDDRKIRGLNKKYLKVDESTDVIAFNTLEAPHSDEISADIAICAETAVSNSKIFKTDCLYELFLYLIHGVLHVLGYDDKTAKQRKIMDLKSEKYMPKNLI